MYDNKYDKIQKAVENMVDKWDMRVLIQYAVDQLTDYYTSDDCSDQEEIDQLIEEHG